MPDSRHPSAILLLVVAASLCGGVASAQNVQYSGALRIGFSDADNAFPGIRLDRGFPVCGPGFTTGATGVLSWATQLVNARGTQVGSGPGATLVFNAVGNGQGGAQEVHGATCGFSRQLHNDTRSATVRTTLLWPSNLGADSPTQTFSVFSPTAPVSYQVAAGGGIPIPGATYMGGNVADPTAPGAVTITRGANHFGGGVPVQARKDHNLARRFGSIPPFFSLSYGRGSYFQFDLSFDRLPIGDAGTQPVVQPGGGTTSSNPHGLLVTRNDQRVVFRTAGGTTQAAHGAVQTAGGGNTATPAGTFSLTSVGPIDCVTANPMPCPRLSAEIQYRGAVFAWTTGRVRISHQGATFQTVRSASGYDIATTGPAGTTRRIQLVSPWSAALVYGPNPFGLPDIGGGIAGMAMLTLNVIPVPEPQAIASLGAGLVGLGLLARRRI